MVDNGQQKVVKNIGLMLKMYNKDGMFEDFDFQFIVLLFDSLLRNIIIPEKNQESRPSAISMIGGTNVGKSTTTNALLGGDHADASMYAAHTRSSTAFISSELNLSDKEIFGSYSFPYHNALMTDGNNTYRTLQYPGSQYLNEVIIWDTPDIDSTAATEYLHFVIETSTLSDLIVLVTTNQKYNNMTAIQIVTTFLSLGFPIIVCFNQFTNQDEELIFELNDSIEDNVSSKSHMVNFLDIHRFPKVDNIQSLYEHDNVDIARRRIKKHLDRNQDERYFNSANWILEHTDEVLRSAIQKARAIDDWDRTVELNSHRMLATYDENYLNNSDNYDAFRSVMAHLLNMLDQDLEGGRKYLRKTRQTAQIPARFLGKQAMKGWKAARKRFSNNEEEVLKGSAIELLVQASDDLFAQMSNLIESEMSHDPHQKFWDTLDEKWLKEKFKLQQQVETDINKHWEDTQAKIIKTASDLYNVLSENEESLKELNQIISVMDGVGLAATIGVALFTGGLGPLDVLWPRITQFIIEKISVNKVETLQQELKDSIRSDTREFIDRNCAKPLYKIGHEAFDDVGGMNADLKAEIGSLDREIRSLVNSD